MRTDSKSEGNIVILEERAKTAISLGESHFREFKSALHGEPGSKVARSTRNICRDIGEALAAFANADGGELLVGVEDAGKVTGLSAFSPTDIEKLTKAPTSHIHPKTPLSAYRSASLILESQPVLYFSVQKSTTHVHLTSDGRCVQRRDLETVPIPAEEIIFSRRERESREYDRRYIDGASARDLDSNILRTVADQISDGMSIEKCLQYLELAEYIGPGLRLRLGALLLFAKDPNRWHPRMQLRIIKIDGTELKTGTQYNAKSDQTVTGNVLELVEKGWEAIRPQLVQTRLGRDARFSGTIMYPELACREALTNAIAHRDYSEEGRGIEIFIYDDRMEVHNPGALLSSLSVDDLRKLQGIHQSRNSTITRVLREVGYMRELGEGMRRMFDLMERNELTEPELFSNKNSFQVTLRHKTIYSPAQQIWLDQFEEFDLTREQKAIVALGLGGGLVSPQDIWERLGIVDTEHYRQLILSLQELDILSSEIPKPRAQQQARRQRVGVRSIPRFKISMPSRRSTTTIGATSAKDKIDETASEAPNPSARLWISNLPPSFVTSDLVSFMSRFSEVHDCYVPRIKESGDSKGFAFVEFDSVATVEKLISKLDGAEFIGRRLVVRKARPRNPVSHVAI